MREGAGKWNSFTGVEFFHCVQSDESDIKSLRYVFSFAEYKKEDVNFLIEGRVFLSQVELILRCLN